MENAPNNNGNAHFSPVGQKRKAQDAPDGFDEKSRAACINRLVALSPELGSAISMAQVVIFGPQSSGKTSSMARLLYAGSAINVPTEIPFVIRTGTATKSRVTTIVHNCQNVHSHKYHLSVKRFPHSGGEGLELKSTNDSKEVLQKMLEEWDRYTGKISLQDEMILKIYSESAMPQEIQDSPGYTNSKRIKETEKEGTEDDYARVLRPNERPPILLFVQAMSATIMPDTSSMIQSIDKLQDKHKSANVVVVLTHADTIKDRDTMETLYEACMQVRNFQDKPSRKNWRFCVGQAAKSVKIVHDDGAEVSETRIVDDDEEMIAITPFRSFLSDKKERDAFICGFVELKRHLDEALFNSLEGAKLQECQSKLEGEMQTLIKDIAAGEIQTVREDIFAEVNNVMHSDDIMYRISDSLTTEFARLLDGYCDQYIATKSHSVRATHNSPSFAYTYETPQSYLAVRETDSRKAYISDMLNSIAMESSLSIAEMALSRVQKMLSEALLNRFAHTNSIVEMLGKVLRQYFEDGTRQDALKAKMQGIIRDSRHLAETTHIPTLTVPNGREKSPIHLKLYPILLYIDCAFRCVMGTLVENATRDIPSIILRDAEESYLAMAKDELAALNERKRSVENSIRAIKDARVYIAKRPKATSSGIFSKMLGYWTK